MNKTMNSQVTLNLSHKTVPQDLAGQGEVEIDNMKGDMYSEGCATNCHKSEDKEFAVDTRE